MNSSQNAIDLYPHSSEEIKPMAFLKLVHTERKNIAAVKILPPVIGQDDFGRIKVTFKTPVYKTLQ